MCIIVSPWRWPPPLSARGDSVVSSSKHQMWESFSLMKAAQKLRERVYSTSPPTRDSQRCWNTTRIHPRARACLTPCVSHPTLTAIRSPFHTTRCWGTWNAWKTPQSFWCRAFLCTKAGLKGLRKDLKWLDGTRDSLDCPVMHRSRKWNG